MPPETHGFGNPDQGPGSRIQGLGFGYSVSFLFYHFGSVLLAA